MAKPEYEIRRGLIVARIWRKKTSKGYRHSTSLIRLYRNGEVWKQSTRLSSADIPAARLVLDLAHTWILQQRNSPHR